MNLFKNRLLIFCAWYMFAGCATNFTDHERRLTVVSGNHSEAVNHTTDWLNSHNQLVVDRGVIEKLGTLHSTPETFDKQQAQMLSMAQKAGASVVVLVQVNENLSEEENLSFVSGKP